MGRTPFTAFGVRVAAEVAGRGITYGDLANAVNTSWSHLSKVLHGQRVSHKLEGRIAAYFGWKEVKA